MKLEVFYEWQKYWVVTSRTYRALANHEMQTWAHNTPFGGIRMTRCFSNQNILLGVLWIAFLVNSGHRHTVANMNFKKLIEKILRIKAKTASVFYRL